MNSKKTLPGLSEFPKPEQPPEIKPPVDPEEPFLPEEDPEIIP